ncbi:uncharacterized protein [Lolium perenne]|uniref:uncharacterized protein n=1 Tax=Lolium perenne TaxID=4522 RepID=UPI0021F5901F|nr:uncharacterized protein LOC127321520 [Lolium perenne]
MLLEKIILLISTFHRYWDLDKLSQHMFSNFLSAGWEHAVVMAGMVDTSSAPCPARKISRNSRTAQKKPGEKLSTSHPRMPRAHDPLTSSIHCQFTTAALIASMAQDHATLHSGVASKNVILNLTASISACLYRPSPRWTQFLPSSSPSTIVSPRCSTTRRSKEVLLKELIACRLGGQ